MGAQPLLKNTEKFAKEVLSIPMCPGLTKHEVKYVSNKIEVF
jgi:dTDP-4-amino-4,6-dideoxygalactose transaminase